MANDNTLNSLYSGTVQGTLATLQTGTTTETAVSMNGNVAAGIASSVGALPLPDASLFDNGKPFIVRAAGLITGNIATTAAVRLYIGSDINLANDAVLVNTTAINCDSQTTQFMLEFKGQWDSTGKKVRGIQTTAVNGTVAGPATSSVASNINTASQLQFVLSGLFGAANAGNKIVVSEFSVEDI